MTELAVQFSGVSRRYPHFALNDISFHLPTGTIMGFIGANGAGKSTTLRILMGLVRQDAGSVNVLGHSMPTPVQTHGGMWALSPRICICIRAPR